MFDLRPSSRGRSLVSSRFCKKSGAVQLSGFTQLTIPNMNGAFDDDSAETLQHRHRIQLDSETSHLSTIEESAALMKTVQPNLEHG